MILIPQLLVAVASIAGLAGSAATALILVLPGDVRLWMVVSVVSASLLVLWGRYRGVERVATVLAVTLGAAALAAAVSVRPDLGQISAGLVPRMPADVDYGEILPWLGFMLSGAAGLIWYSYWIPAKGYGAAELSHQIGEPIDATKLEPEEQKRLRGWIAQMTLDTTVAVVGTLVIALAFLILGTELLRPQGLVPEEARVAEVLGELLGGVWGRAGFWFMVLGVFVGFWDTVLSDQDGFGRMFADGTRRLLRSWGIGGRWVEETFLQRGFVLVLVTALPIALYLTTGSPVALLKLAGAIEAAHIPIVAGLTLYLTRRDLPPDLRPSWLTAGATLLAALFFAAFAALYVVRLVLPG